MTKEDHVELIKTHTFMRKHATGTAKIELHILHVERGKCAYCHLSIRVVGWFDRSGVNITLFSPKTTLKAGFFGHNVYLMPSTLHASFGILKRLPTNLQVHLNKLRNVMSSPGLPKQPPPAPPTVLFFEKAYIQTSVLPLICCLLTTIL